MKLIKRPINLLAVSLGALMLSGQAVAMPIASLDYQGQLDFSLSDGLSVEGTLEAFYMTPPPAPTPYQFNTQLSFEALEITPTVTVTTPEIELIPGLFTLPSVDIPISPSIPLVGSVEVFDLSYTSPELPLGGISLFDFGTPLLGEVLTVDDLVQEQFETGATSFSEVGDVIGPLVASYSYDGELQPDGKTILADYTLDISGPGLLGDIEDSVLSLVNDNTDLLADFALDAVLATNPCSGLGFLEGICNGLLSALEGSDLGISVDSLGVVSADYSHQKSIVALQAPEPVPAPGTLPLVALGMAFAGLAARRRAR